MSSWHILLGMPQTVKLLINTVDYVSSMLSKLFNNLSTANHIDSYTQYLIGLVIGTISTEVSLR